MHNKSGNKLAVFCSRILRLIKGGKDIDSFFAFDAACDDVWDASGVDDLEIKTDSVGENASNRGYRESGFGGVATYMENPNVEQMSKRVLTKF